MLAPRCAVVFMASSIACFGAIHDHAFAQTLASVTGKVTTESGEPLSSVRITIVELNLQDERTFTSARDGTFVIRGLQPGRYQLTAEKRGFTSFQSDVLTLRATDRQTINAKLIRRSMSDIPPLGSPGTGQPQGKPAAPVSPTPRPKPSASTPQVAMTKVFFVTDRNRVNTGVFGRRRGAGLSYGTCIVSIPRDHKLAQIERPEWWNFFHTDDPEKYFVISLRFDSSRDGFYSELRAATMSSASRQALVFIHGFNVAFDDAVYRTAQIAYDLGFDGVPIVYSWPAYDGTVLTDYLAALNNNDWTQPHLETVLRELVRDSGATTLHIIGHSMGNRVLVRALATLSQDAGLNMNNVINHVVLAAPDIDADVFRQLAAGVRAASRHVTLYASKNDKALLLSKKLQGNYTRAGDAASPTVLPGIDTIDASAVDTDLIGHFYYGSNRSVLSDMFALLARGDPPNKRFGIVKVQLGDANYWAFRP